MEEKNFFKKFWTSITDFEGYEELAAGSTFKTIIYIIILTLIFTAVIVGINVFKLNASLDDVKDYVSKNIEDITYKDGKLDVKTEEPIIIESEENVIPIIIIDTKDYENKAEYLEKTQNYREKLKAYNVGIILLDDHLVIRNSMLTEGNDIIEYEKILDLEITGKDGFINVISGRNLMAIYAVISVAMLFYLFIIYLTANIMDIIILGVIGKIFGLIVKLKLRYKATFNIGAYALTLPMILNLIYIIVNTFIDFEIKYFSWMYTSISYIYVVVAILMIKTEIIHQRMQLIKLEQIQKQEAQKAQEEVEKEKTKEEENKKENEENKEEKQTKKEEKTGEQPV